MNATIIAKPFPAPGKPSFWLLQVAGWAAYFILNATAVIGEGTELRYVYVSLAVTLSGFVLTSLLRLGYRRLWSLPLPRMAQVYLHHVEHGRCIALRLSLDRRVGSLRHACGMTACRCPCRFQTDRSHVAQRDPPRPAVSVAVLVDP